MYILVLDMASHPCHTVRERCAMNAMLDIPFVSPEPQKGVVKKLSQRHRNLARLLAKGHRPGECAMILRLSASWVSVIQTDPAFQELVKFYQATADAEFKRTAEKLADLSEEVIDELHGRLEEDPASFSPNQLAELLKITADRSGHGPTSTQRHVHALVTVDYLNDIKQKVAADNTGTVALLPSFDTKDASLAALVRPDDTGSEESNSEEGLTISGESVEVGPADSSSGGDAQ